MKNENIKLLIQLEELLKNHDWYYAMSDDHYYYTKGRKQSDKIQQTGKTYITQDNDEVKVIHNHDSIINIGSGYYKNKLTNEWISEDEYYDSLCLKMEEDESNKYF